MSVNYFRRPKPPKITIAFENCIDDDLFVSFRFHCYLFGIRMCFESAKLNRLAFVSICLLEDGTANHSSHRISTGDWIVLNMFITVQGIKSRGVASISASKSNRFFEAKQLQLHAFTLKMQCVRTFHHEIVLVHLINDANAHIRINY